MDISLKEASFEFQGNGGFARPSESGEQNSCRTVSERRASFLRTHTGSLVGQNGPGLGFPMCRGGLSRKPDHPRSHGDIGQPVDDDKRQFRGCFHNHREPLGHWCERPPVRFR